LDIYVLQVTDRSLKKVVDTQGPDTNPVWSPDGEQIAYETSAGAEFFYYTNPAIAVVPAGGGKPRVLTEGFDEVPRLLTWAPAGIYFSALQKTARHLFRIDPKRGAIERVGLPNALAFTTYSFSEDGRQVALIHAGANEFPEVCLSPVEPFALRRLT